MEVILTQKLPKWFKRLMLVFTFLTCGIVLREVIGNYTNVTTIICYFILFLVSLIFSVFVFKYKITTYKDKIIFEGFSKQELRFDEITGFVCSSAKTIYLKADRKKHLLRFIMTESDLFILLVWSELQKHGNFSATDKMKKDFNKFYRASQISSIHNYWLDKYGLIILLMLAASLVILSGYLHHLENIAFMEKEFWIAKIAIILLSAVIPIIPLMTMFISVNKKIPITVDILKPNDSVVMQFKQGNCFSKIVNICMFLYLLLLFVFLVL